MFGKLFSMFIVDIMIWLSLLACKALASFSVKKKKIDADIE